MNTIEVKNISKSYGKVLALSDVSFAVGQGEVFGLIGPDGAGKTSMFRILCSLLLPDAEAPMEPARRRCFESSVRCCCLMLVRRR